MLLFQRLRNEAERKSSTPSMRLLDDLLFIMDADVGSSETARLEAAAERMDMSFNPNGGVLPQLSVWHGAVGCTMYDLVLSDDILLASNNVHAAHSITRESSEH